VAGVEMTGVDPRVEQRATRYVRTVAEGRYLREDDAGAVVIGRALAEQLDVALDDDLMVTLVGRDGGLEAAMLRIVGIVDTGSRELDAAVCQVTLSELQRITDIPGAGEISILLKDANRMPRAADALRRRLPAGDEVLTWMQVAPELYGGVKMDEGFAKISIGIIVIVVLLGVMSAQLTAALERRREFAVLTALGMRAGQIARLLLVETVLLGVAGGLLGLLLAAPIVYYLATVGLNLANMMGGEVVFANIMLDPILYSDFGPWMIGYSLLTALSATLLASLYPAWFAARTDPAAAMRVT
jgi:ABC-type lipoprotein release transport system permease subunit